MPTITQGQMESQELVFGAGGERREPEGRPEWTGGGALAAGDPTVGRSGRALSPELVDGTVDRGAGRRRVRQALGVGSDRRISDEVIDELLAGASSEEDLALQNAVPQWTRTRNWTTALLAFKIHFGDRVPNTTN